MRTMMMGSGSAAAATMAEADVVIRPGSAASDSWSSTREAGRTAAREALPQILALVHH